MKSPTPNWADRIHEALEQTANAFRALHEARKARLPTATLDRVSQEAADRSNALRAECRDAFATSRGFTWNKKAYLYTSDYGSNGTRIIDHAEFFDAIDQRRVALVTHSYAPATDLADYAARQNFTAELLPFSWHNPRYSGGARAVLFSRRVGASWPK